MVPFTKCYARSQRDLGRPCELHASQVSCRCQMNMAKTSFKNVYSLVLWEVPIFGLFPTKLKSLTMPNAVKGVGMKFSVSRNQLIRSLGSGKRIKNNRCLFTFTFLMYPG